MSNLAKMNYHFRQLILYVLILSLTTLPLAAKPEKPHNTVVNGKRKVHRFQLRFVTGSFRRTFHKITGAKGKELIDGKPERNKDGSKNWYGTDGGLPDQIQEFYSFQVRVDGRKWSVPPRLWSDCYDPNSPLWTQLSPDGKKLALGM